MKRNGAGLASICILSTMVLVMISSTSCLYIGSEDMLRQRYPRNMILETNTVDTKYTDYLHQVIDEQLAAHRQTEENTIHYHYVSFSGIMEDNTIIFDKQAQSFSGFFKYSGIIILWTITIRSWELKRQLRKELYFMRPAANDEIAFGYRNFPRQKTQRLRGERNGYDANHAVACCSCRRSL
ncbi:MAG: hypothetical protein ACLSFZ_08910 [Frisingicoccus sp.]